MIGLAVVPVFFKEDIELYVKEEVNNNLEAIIDFESTDLKLLSTFPELTFDINGFTLTGKGVFEDLVLAEVEQIKMELDLWKIFSGTYEIKKIHLNHPKIHLKVLPNGKANYDIYRTSSGQIQQEIPSNGTPFTFKIESYEILGGAIIYNDETYLTNLKLENLNHAGAFTLVNDKYELQTKSTASGLTLNYDHIDYINNSEIDIDFDGEIDFIEENILFKIVNNTTIINDFKVKLNGEFHMKEESYEMDISISTLDQTFKSILSIVPGMYNEDFSSINCTGDFAFSGRINGVYDEINYPAFDLDLKINNGQFKYPDLPNSVNNILLGLKTSSPGGDDLNDVKIEIDNFSLNFLENQLMIKLKLANLINDPNFNGLLKSSILLTDIEKVIPMNGEKLSGTISSDLLFDGRLSNLENEEYDQLKSSGQLNFSNVNYQSNSLTYDLSIHNLKFIFSPEKLVLEQFSATIGESDVNMTGTMNNYFQYFLNDDLLEGNFQFRSNNLNLDELLISDSGSATEIDSSSITVTDQNLNHEVISIPDNLNFTMNTSIDNMIYDSLPIKSFSGEISLKDGEMLIKQFGMNVFDGEINMNGDYMALSPKRAKVNLTLELIDISFNESYNYFNSVKKYAPLVKCFDGDFTTVIQLETLLDEYYNPIYENLTSSGKLQSKEVKVLDFPLVNQLKDVLKELINKNKSIEDLNLSYHFDNGKFTIEETPLKLNNIEAYFHGSTSINQELDYSIKTKISISDISKGVKTSLSSLNISNDLYNELPLEILIGGEIKNPEITTNINDNKENIKQGLINKGKDIVNEQVEDIKQDGLIEAQKKADKIIEEAKSKADLIRKESKSKADLIENNAKGNKEKAYKATEKELNKVRKEGYDKADQIEKNAKTPLAKIAAQKTADKVRKETDKKVENLKRTLNEKADNAELLALNNAQKIRDEGENNAQLIEDTAKDQSEKTLEQAKNK